MIYSWDFKHSNLKNSSEKYIKEKGGKFPKTLTDMNVSEGNVSGGKENSEQHWHVKLIICGNAVSIECMMFCT